MKCCILCVGTELLWGKTVNTNATFLSKELNKLGFDVYYHYAVGDNPQRLQESIEYFLGKVDLIICTGGLGPTEDDLTKEIIAKTFNKELILDNKVLSGIQGYFDFINKQMTENNVKQAYLPEDCMPFYNKVGSAPGFALNENDKIIVALPGPPKEMKGMWENDVKSYLEKFADNKFYYKNIQFFGIGESHLETILLPLIHGQQDPTFATYVGAGQCTLRIASKSKDENVAKKKVEKAASEVRKLAGQYIFSEKGEILQEVVCKKLVDSNLTISACESCTGGMFASKLIDYPGISQCLGESYVAYSNDAKNRILGVKIDTLDKYTAVSEEVALEMVEGLYNKTKADVCVSVTGLAGPDGGSEEIPVGTVFIAVKYNGTTTVEKKKFHNKGRQYIREHACINMLNMVYKAIK